ncbi:MAG: hypothetical protein ACLTLQ_10820 [[Clostridium] scindens]
MEHYGENGAGFYLDSRSIPFGTTPKVSTCGRGRNRAAATAATLIPWNRQPKRIRELLDLGRYMPQSELDRVTVTSASNEPPNYGISGRILQKEPQCGVPSY